MWYRSRLEVQSIFIWMITNYFLNAWFAYYSFRKKTLLLMLRITQGTSQTFRWSYDLLFDWLDVSRDQIKSNWTADEGLLASEKNLVSKRRLFLFKGKWTFLLFEFFWLFWKLVHFVKHKLSKSLLLMTRGAQKTAEKDGWNYPVDMFRV